MTKYFYVNSEGQEVGPVDKAGLADASICADTSVWCDGLDGWTPAINVPDLQEMFPGVAPANKPVATPQKPDSYLWLGILTSILCFLPFGIVSIVYAAKVDSLWKGGNHEGARTASQKACFWGSMAVVSDLIVMFLLVICG